MLILMQIMAAEWVWWGILYLGKGYIFELVVFVEHIDSEYSFEYLFRLFQQRISDLLRRISMLTGLLSYMIGM